MLNDLGYLVRIMTPQKEFIVAFRLLLSKNINKVYVLPFTSIDNKLYILMGQQKRTNKLVAFETVNPSPEKFFEDISEKFNLDTYEIFRSPKILGSPNFKMSPALISISTAVIFLYVNPKHKAASRDRFKYLLNTSESTNQSLVDIRWISFGNFEKLIQGEKQGMSTSIKSILQEIDLSLMKSALTTSIKEE